MPRVRRDEYGETVTAPTPLRLTPLPVVQQQPQIVDRVEYLREQQAMRQADAQAAQQRALDQIAEMRRRAAPALNALSNAQRLSEQFRVEGLSDRARYVEDFGRQRDGSDFGGNVLNRVVDVARTNIPDVIREPAKRVVSESLQQAAYGGPIGRIFGEAVEAIPGNPLGGVRNKIADTAAEVIVPRELWEAALEVSPFGTVGDIRRAVSEGSPEAIKALRQVAGDERTTQVIRALQSERGALKVGGGDEIVSRKVQEQFRPSRTRMVPGARVFATDRNNFGRIISTDPTTGRASVYFRSPSGGEATIDLPIDSLNVITQGGRKVGSKLVPLSNEQMAQAWELLPPENQKLIGIVAQTSLTETERAARLAASRSAKTGNIADIFKGEGTPGQKLAQAWSARRGADLPSQPALREFFDDADVTSYERQIVDAANSGLVTPQEATNAGSVLDLLMTGTRRNGTQTPVTQGERSLIGRIFGPELEKVLPTTPEKMTRMQKLLAPLQIWRSIKSGFDNSALGRQGRKVMFSDPAEWMRSIKPNLQALSSERGYEQVMDMVHNADHYALGQSLERPLGIMERGTNEADEWLSPVTKHIPFLRPFERAYLGYLNAVRQAAFDKDVNALIKAFGGLENVPIDEIKRSADSVNNSTMFGNLSALGENSRVAGQTFFSARGLVSGPQFHADFLRAMAGNASPTMRKIIARRWAAYVGSSLASMMAASQTGYMLNEQGVPVAVGVEFDPWSSSFGEVRAGPVKFNPWGADIVPLRATLQWIMGQQTAEGDTEPQKKSRNEIAGRFVQSKLAPATSLGFDLVFNQGRDFQGRPIIDRPWEYAIEQSSPIFWYDVQDSMREQGWWGLGSIGQAIGLDVQVYGATESTAKRAGKRAIQDKLREAGFPDRDQTFEAKEGFRQQWADAFGVDEAEPTFAEFRKNRIAEAVKRGLSEKEAAYRFDNHEFTNLIEQRQRAARLEFWRNNSALLREAIDAGVEDWSQEKGEILGR